MFLPFKFDVITSIVGFMSSILVFKKNLLDVRAIWLWHLLFIIYLFNLYCIFLVFIVFFSCYHLVPLYFPSPSNHHIVDCDESFFLFAQSLHPLTSPPPLAVILLSIYESVFNFLISSVCSLDSTYGIYLSLTGSFHLA